MRARAQAYKYSTWEAQRAFKLEWRLLQKSLKTYTDVDMLRYNLSSHLHTAQDSVNWRAVLNRIHQQAALTAREMILSVFGVTPPLSKDVFSTKPPEYQGMFTHERKANKTAAELAFAAALDDYYLEIEGEQAANLAAVTDMRAAGAIAEAGSVEEALASITSLYGRFNDSRSSTIGLTEGGGAYNHGATATVREESLAQYKVWCCTFSNSRDWHMEADGQTVKIDEPFIVDGEDMQEPCDPAGSGANVVNCMCWMSYTDEPPAGSIDYTIP